MDGVGRQTKPKHEPIPRPPPRQPKLFDEEQGASRERAALGVLYSITSRLDGSTDWQTSAGRLQLASAHEGRESAQYRVTGAVDGEIGIRIGPDGWIVAELRLTGGELVRAWIERPYEEFELWPDGASGELADPKTGDAPGRIGKRMSWMQLDTQHWTGLEAFGRYFDAEQIWPRAST